MITLTQRHSHGAVWELVQCSAVQCCWDNSPSYNYHLAALSPLPAATKFTNYE